MDTLENPKLPHIVVLGAGFGGLTFAKRFPARLARITVVDRQNHHLFQPLLYQVATAGLAAPDIAQPIRSILRGKPNLAVLMAEARAVDLTARVVTLDRGQLTYDYLVLGIGGQTSYFGHPEWEPLARGLKSLDDALRIRREVLLAFEHAEMEADPARRDQLMTLVVVGGGPTGVELAGTLAELARTVLRRDFDRIDAGKARVLLVEGGPRVLAAYPENLSASAQRQLARLGVDVRTGTMVRAIRDGEVDLGTETVRAAVIIWAAGVAAHPLTRTLGVATDRAGRLKVAPDLSLPDHPEVFALGDIVTLVDRKGVTVPGIAPAAMQMGAHVAKLIAREIGAPRSASPREAFAYRDKGSMATIGRSAAVAWLGRLQFGGWPAWAAWLGVHLVFLIGFRNKLSVFLQWVYSYWTYRRGARIITGRGETP
ncbi:MAG TPA: NAD(P)/FAD-dependent oxidoreductase [Opitutaceae bacterium]|nr:NAD(P)/FAD-dependent oxidoreductase [Opitutaceae bacterium]